MPLSLSLSVSGSVDFLPRHLHHDTVRFTDFFFFPSQLGFPAPEQSGAQLSYMETESSALPRETRKERGARGTWGRLTASFLVSLSSAVQQTLLEK